MKMKFKLLLVLLIAFGIALPQSAFCATDKKVQLPNSFIYQAISKYKGKKYSVTKQGGNINYENY